MVELALVSELPLTDVEFTMRFASVEVLLLAAGPRAGLNFTSARRCYHAMPGHAVGRVDIKTALRPYHLMYSEKSSACRLSGYCV